MNSKDRLALAFDLQTPDRPPILGGWLAAPNHIRAITGCSEEEYWSNPFDRGMEAERALGSDGLIDVFEPVARGEYRCVDHRILAEREAYTLESVLREVEALPDPDQVAAEFHEESAYAEFLTELATIQGQCGDMLWCPADFWMIPKALWYERFGYETALLLVGLYPDHVRRLIAYSAATGRQRALLRARAIGEGLHPKAILTGEDLCSQQGPMVSPKFLRQHYWPLVEWAIEPLLAVGAKIVWHCDGNYRPLLDDVLSCGVAGLQGFQRECGMDLAWLVDLKTRTGDPLLFFGPMSVTTTLPHGTPDDVRAEVRLAMDICRDKASLVFFTSNTLTPDIPLENILTYWKTVLKSTW